MSYFPKLGLLLSILILVGGGCINITVNGVDIPLEELTDETSQFVDEVSDIDVYGNVHGYSIEYPADKTLWSSLDQNTQTMIEATEEDLIVNLAEDEGVKLFQTTMNTLRFEIISSEEDPIVWARANMQEFDFIEAENNFFGDHYSYVETRVQEAPALDIYGGANIGSKYRTLIIDLGDELLVITQGLQSDEFNAVFESLTIE